MEVRARRGALGGAPLLRDDLGGGVSGGVHRLLQREHRESTLLVTGDGRNRAGTDLRLHSYLVQQSARDAHRQQPF